MFFGNRDAIIPSNEAEMDQHCSSTRGGIGCMQDFTATCLTGMAQKSFGVFLKNMAIHLDTRCGNPTERKEFMEHVKCFNPRDKIEPMNVCNDKHVVMTEKIKDVDLKLMMLSPCCAFNLYRDCIISKSKEVCGEGSSQYWDDMIQEVAEESMTISCSNFETVAKCQSSLKSDIWSQFKLISDSNDSNVYKHSYKTQLPIMLEIINKFKM